MSGHSKWATTKHKKAVIDAKRGKLFAKLIKNIEVAARTGGADPDGNPTLFDAIQKAKKSSVPNKNIDSAVKRGAGLEAGGADYETIMYEGYGPNGVAVLIECLTDNRNRAASDVRVAMTRNGGSMADPGSVSYLFNRKGVVIVPKGELAEDDVLGAVLDAGAEEVNDLGESFEVHQRGHRPGRGPHRAPGGRHRLRLGRRQLRPDHAGRAGRGRRAQDLQADRRAGGQRRRAERLRQLRRLATRSWRRSTPDGRSRTAERRADGTHPVGPSAVSASQCRPAIACSEQADRAGEEGGGVRVLGVDPGLTRCGVGVVDGVAGRPLTMVGVGVVRTPADAEIGHRLVAHRARHRGAGWTSTGPNASPWSGCSASTTCARSWAPPRPAPSPCSAPPAAACPVALHTPSEVKAAVTGSGRADKAQVGAMVTRLLRLDAPPRPADAADALALAICHIWRGPATNRLQQAAAPPATGPPRSTDRTGGRGARRTPRPEGRTA